jgi:hypothetical protein
MILLSTPHKSLANQEKHLCYEIGISSSFLLALRLVAIQRKPSGEPHLQKGGLNLVDVLELPFP